MHALSNILNPQTPTEKYILSFINQKGPNNISSIRTNELITFLCMNERHLNECWGILYRHLETIKNPKDFENTCLLCISMLNTVYYVSESDLLITEDTITYNHFMDFLVVKLIDFLPRLEHIYRTYIRLPTSTSDAVNYLIEAIKSRSLTETNKLQVSSSVSAPRGPPPSLKNRNRPQITSNDVNGTDNGLQPVSVNSSDDMSIVLKSEELHEQSSHMSKKEAMVVTTNDYDLVILGDKRRDGRSEAFDGYTVFTGKHSDEGETDKYMRGGRLTDKGDGTYF